MTQFQKIEGRGEWQELLGKVLFKTFFHNLEWEEFLEKQFSWLKFERYIYRDSVLLSLAKFKIFKKEKLISHPFCEYGGPLPLRKKIDGKEFQKDLFKEFKFPFRIIFHPEILNYFENLEKAESEREAFFIKDFDRKTKDNLWRNFRKTLRHSIIKAENQGLKIKKCGSRQELRNFYNLYLKGARKHKIPAYPFSFFEEYNANDGNMQTGKAEIVLAEFQNKIIAGSVFLFYNGFIHYFLNASDEKYKNFGANCLILWEQIQNYSGRDYQVFDLGGTRAGSSLEVFKQGWGGEKYPILEISNKPAETKNKFQDSKLREIFGFLPLFLIEKFSPCLLKYKL